MKRVFLVIASIVAIISSSLFGGSVKAQSAKFRIAFVPGTSNPFYKTMQQGVEQAAADLEVEVEIHVPPKLDPAVQTPIIEAIAADKSVNALIAAPTDSQQQISVFQDVDKAGIPVITVGSFIGNGDYADGNVKFPLSFIGSDSMEGGHIACNALAEAIAKKGKVYIQNVNSINNPGDNEREQGCKDALEDYPGIMLVGEDYNSDDAKQSQTQTAVVLQRDHDLVGIFAANEAGVQGAVAAVSDANLTHTVQVVGLDATPTTVQRLKDGLLSVVVAEKPYDMGYTAVGYAVAQLSGVTSLPKRVKTGYAVINNDNLADPQSASYFYSSTASALAPPLTRFKVAYVAGTVDPFYQVLEKGIDAAAQQMSIEVTTQVPQKWDPAVQTAVIETIAADKSVSVLITAAVDKQQMIPVLDAVDKAGIPVITVDQFIGDGDYVNGPVRFPLSYISSDNEAGGRMACVALAEAIGKKGKVYIQNVTPGISATDQREQGCKDALGDYPDIKFIGTDYNQDDASTAEAQTTAVLQREKDLAGIFGTNVFSAEGAGTAIVNAGLKGVVQVVAFDATRDAVEKLYDGIVTVVIAQKPYDMGYLATFYAVAHARGVSSIPKRIPTGFAVIDINNVGDPDVSRFIYR